jgi:hypothetical protein
MDVTEKRKQAFALFSGMERVRGPWDVIGKQIKKYQVPRLGRFNTSEKDQRANSESIAHDGIKFAHRTLSSGLQSGATNPARPWLRLTLRNRELAESAAVRKWLHQGTELILAVAARSDTYQAFHSAYDEIGAFGNAAVVLQADFDNVVRSHVMTFGEWVCARNANGEGSAFGRKFRMTAGQMVLAFGKDRVSPEVLRAAQGANQMRDVDVLHVIQERADKVGKSGYSPASRKRYSSCYYDLNHNTQEPLRESGYDRFPVLLPRWYATSNDTYGYGPGYDCLNSSIALQHISLRGAQALDYRVSPPVRVPTMLKGDNSWRMPGGVLYTDAQDVAIRNLYEVQVNLQEISERERELMRYVREAYYTDLFLMLQSQPLSGSTATEIAQRYEEKMTVLGPAVGRLHLGLIAPWVEFTFDQLVDKEVMPPAPPEIQDEELEIEFVSTLAQAQKQVEGNTLDRFMGTVGQIAQLAPRAVHKVKGYKFVDKLADVLGVDPDLVASDDEADEAASGQEQAQAQAQAVAAAPALARAAKDAAAPEVQDVIQNTQTAQEAAA